MHDTHIYLSLKLSRVQNVVLLFQNALRETEERHEVHILISTLVKGVHNLAQIRNAVYRL